MINNINYNTLTQDSRTYSITHVHTWSSHYNYVQIKGTCHSITQHTHIYTSHQEWLQVRDSTDGLITLFKANFTFSNKTSNAFSN